MLSGYQYYRDDVIDHTKIDSDLTDFPVTVFLSSSNFDFSHVRSDMNDVRFTDTSDNLYKQEGELRDQANSEAIFHVKVPSVSSAADTTIRNQYDNPDETSNGDDAANVWDSNFKMVQHMNDNPDTSHITDSTSNGNDGTKYAAGEPAEADGSLGKGQDFDGSNDYVNCGHDASLDITGQALTVEAFPKYNVDPTSFYGFLLNKASSQDQVDVSWYLYNRSTSSELQFTVTNASQTTATALKSFDSGWTGTSKYIVGTYDGSNVRLYADLVEGTSDALTGDIQSKLAYDLYISYRIENPLYYHGILDEIRISDVVRSSAWIKATYNSIYDTLLTYGTEETPSQTYYQTLSATEVSSSTLTMAASFYRTLSVVESSVATLTQKATHFVSLITTEVSQATLTAQQVIGKTLSVVENSVVSLAKLPKKVLSIIESSVASLLHSVSAYRMLSVVETSIPSLVKKMGRVLSVTESSVVSLLRIRYVELAVQEVSKVSLTLLKTCYRTLSVVSTGVVSLAKTMYKSLILPTVSTATVTLLTTHKRMLSVVESSVVTLQRQMWHTVTMSVNIITKIWFFLNGRRVDDYRNKYSDTGGTYDDKYPDSGDKDKYTDKY